MLVAVLALQVSFGSTHARPFADSSKALDALIARAAVVNAQVPPTLRTFRARLESEIAVALRSSVDRESAIQLEQVESTVSWTAPSVLEQRVIGYRARAVTANVSALTYFRRPWIVPMLYGNRLRVLFSHDHAPDGDGHGGSLAVHPFALDRQRYYRYAGGDTVEILRTGDRAIPLVRVEVTPREGLGSHLLLFRGEIDVDASRAQIVRMRGEFLQPTDQRSLGSRVAHLVLRSIAFAELVNGEFLGEYWLPTYQRIEAQGRSSVAAELRPVFRVISRFREYSINDASASDVSPMDGNVLERLTSAPRDSITHFSGWIREIGQETVEARASDFDDVAPDAWRSSGEPRLDWHAEHVSDVFRFNRVEGAFTGASATWRLRDRAPGLAVGAHGGWAWAEGTARGTLFVRRQRGMWRVGAEVERALPNSNDFRPTLDFESSLMALLVTADDYDYVDRRRLNLSVSRSFRATGGLRFETGPATDRAALSHVRYGLIHLDSSFRVNRAIDPGSYWRTALAVDMHPNVSGEFLEPGIGAGLNYERGDGRLRWQRIEGRLIGRHTWRALTYAARLDAAAVFGAPVPRQQLIEFGENEGLPGYLFKEFGGDRAVLVRGNVAYNLPLLNSPVRVGRGIVLPSLAPAIAVGIQGGWAGASASTLAQLETFGVRTDSLTGAPIRDPRTGRSVLATRPTDGMKSTVGVSLRLFGGAFSVGLARSIDRRRPWSITFGVGQGL